MAYFSNGTDGQIYQEEFCLKCVNWVNLNDGRDYGCPIMDAHMVFEIHKGPQAEVLRHFIPDSTFNDDHALCHSECIMFKTLESVGIKPLDGVERPFKLESGETGFAIVE